MEKINYFLKKSCTSLIKIYSYLISPLLGNRCRFYPSCSSYAVTAIETRGVIIGCYLALRRILRCHPWHPGGIDSINETKKQ